MFKKFVAELVAAKTDDQVNYILYREDGVDMAFQKEKISWKEHELLFQLAGALAVTTFAIH